MSNRLSDLTVGSIKTTKRRRRVKKAPATAEPMMEDIPDVPDLKRVPGIEPFVLPSLVVDLLFMMHRVGIESWLDAHLPNDASGVSLEAVPEQDHSTRHAILTTFEELGFEEAVRQISSIAGKDVRHRIIRRGVKRMQSLVDSANPEYPPSIVFRDKSQDVHRQTKKAELDLFLNEADVVERKDVQCGMCKSKKINAVTVQRRSADEPPDVTFSCTSCKHRWTSSAA